MTESIRILILEDNPADAELVQFELQEAGLIFTAKVVATEEEYVRAIQDCCPDLILSDYDLPRYSGALALAEANRRCPDTPFILVTGAVTEDRAIDILTEGAKDYVLKKRLQQRLAPAVRRALAEAEEHRARKRAEAELREAYKTVEENVRTRTAELEAEMSVRKRTEETLRYQNELQQTILDGIPAMVAFLDREGRLTYLNRCWQSTLGWSLEEMQKHQDLLADLYPDPGYRERVLDFIRSAAGRWGDFKTHTRDGNVLDTSWVNVPLSDGTNIGIGIDITERKRMEEALRDERRRLQSIIEGTRVGTWEWNVQTGEVVINETWAKIVGYAPEELSPVSIETWRRLAHPDDLKRSDELLERHFAGNLPYYDCECRMKHKDGHWVWVHDRGRIITRTEDGKPSMMFGTHLDITDRKRAEQEMFVIAEVGRIVTSTIDVDEVYEAFALQVGKLLSFDRIVISIIRPDGKTTRSVYIAGEEIRERNKKDIYPIEGSGHAEMLRTKSTVLIQTDDFREYEERFPRLRSTFQAGFRSIMNVPLFSKGEIIGALLLRSRKCPAYSEADVRLAERIGTQIAGAIANAQLFNNLSEMERELREITGSLHLATASAKAGVWDWNLKTNDVIWDKRMLELYGLARDNFPGRIEAWENALHPDDSSRAIGECQAALRGERDFDTEFRIRRPDGTVVHIKANGIVLRDEAGKPLRMIGLNVDITEREQSVEALQDSEERHRRIVEALSDAVLLFTEEKIIYVNPAALKLFRANGPGDLLGKSYFAFVHPDDRAMSIERVKKSTDGNWIAPSREHRVSTLDGQPVHVESVCVPIKYRGETQVFVAFRDISMRRRAEEERARLQEQLLQSQKMESIGRLAGGVAHDFNNMLGVILGHAEMAMDQVDPNQPLHANLEAIRKAANHSADLTRQLLAFARKQVVSPKILDLNETVAGMLKMLQRLIGEDIQLAWLPGANVWPVKVDPSQIDQILANLSVNARDAIAGVGKLTIETQNVRSDAAFCADRAGCVPGEYVLLSVRDDGCGMDKEIFSHLFEPFFTTKETGKGTGLGLATVYGIVKQNNGFIDVSSEPGQGTVMKVYLPRHIGKPQQIMTEGSQEPVTRGHETVLVAEDEAALLDLSRMILESQGYRVLTASTPGEAIRLANDHPGEIHLLLTDVVMPEMNGRELAKIILSLYPNMKRLFMSGYTADVIAHRGVLDDGAHFIQKPFSRKGLAVKVREVLGGAG